MKHVMLIDGGHYGITDEMEGKMLHMHSLNTSAECNPFCQRMRQTAGMICQSCYSKSTERRFKLAHLAFENNYHVLSERLLTAKELPVIRKDIFRFQAHGDLVNRTHYLNLIQIAEANPETTFALWTKNLPVIRDGGLVRLSNLIYIYSTPMLDCENPKKPRHFNKCFSVFSRPFAAKYGVKINCAKECNSCRLCYQHNDIEYINELIKSNGHK